MYEVYDGSHSITIGKLITKTQDGKHFTSISGKNTWSDWHLIPSSRPLVNPPSPNTKTISVPGANGSLDFSSLLTGYMTYQDRTGSWEFIVANDYWKTWEIAYSTLMAYLHGESLVCVLEDEPEYYYEGLFGVNSWKSDKDWSRIVIDYSLYPYKRTIQFSDEPWLWDPFSFETGVIRNYGSISLASGASKTIKVIASEEPVIPEIYSNSNDVVLTTGGKTRHLKSGTNTYPGLRIKQSESSKEVSMVFKNNGDSSAEIKVIYRGGEF